MLHFITGKKQSGKTTLAHKILQKAVAEKKSTMLIVPKQYTFESDKKILSLLGPKDASEVEVLSFSRLVNTAMNRYGGIKKPIAKEGARVIFMSLAIESLSDKLTVFSKHKNDFALVKKLLSCVTELKKEGISSDELYCCSEKVTDKTLKAKLRETALIYAAYDALLSESRFDDADVLTEMAKVLFETDFFKDKVLVLDGFSEFSFGEKKLIEVMLTQCEDVYVTLCTDNIFSDDIMSPFSAVNKTAKALLRLSEKLSVGCAEPLTAKENTKAFPEDISYLENNLFELSAPDYEGEGENIALTESPDIYKECDAAARKIKSFLREEKYRCRDISVVYREGDSYERLMKASFRKYGIPYFEDRRQPIENQPLISFVKSLFELLNEGFQSDSVFRFLKTGLLRASSDDIALAENYTFAWDINGSRWQKEWTANPEGFQGEMGQREKENLKIINALREKVVALVQNFKGSLKDETGKGITEKLYRFLTDNGVGEALKEYALSLQDEGHFELALEQEQVWDVLMEVLDEIATALNDKAISLKRYSEIFELIVSSKSLGKLPDGFDEVSVLVADRVSTRHSKVVFVLGLNSGVFPLQQPSSGFFSIREKEKMDSEGLEVGDSVKDFISKEKFILYSTLFSASEKLFLSYVTNSPDGEKLKESECIRSIRKLFPSLETLKIAEEKTENLIESEKAAFELMAEKWHENSPESEALKKYFRGKPEYIRRLSAIERATDEKNFSFENSEKAVELFGRNMAFSASQMEVYYKCPFMYFCKYGVYAKPRLKARLDPAQSGTIVHYCLEKILGKYKGREFLRLTDEKIREEIKNHLREYIDKNMGGSEDKTDRFNYLYMRTDKILRHLMDRILSEFTSSDFEMCAFELKIGKNGDVEPIEIELKEGSVQIKGFVDRVDKLDIDEKRYIRVIDYKTGAKEFLLSDVLYGLNMQMLLYLVSIVRSKEGFYKDSVPAGVLYFPANIKPVAAERSDDTESRQKKIYSLSKMNGMLVGDEDVISRMDKEKEGLFLPARFDSKGALKGNFISLTQFEKLGRYMDNLIKEMGDSIHEGKIPAIPALGPNHSTTCEWCDYSEVCLRENGEYRYIDNLKHDDALRMISGGESCENEVDC